MPFETTFRGGVESRAQGEIETGPADQQAAQGAERRAERESPIVQFSLNRDNRVLHMPEEIASFAVLIYTVGCSAAFFCIGFLSAYSLRRKLQAAIDSHDLSLVPLSKRKRIEAKFSSTDDRWQEVNRLHNMYRYPLVWGGGFALFGFVLAVVANVMGY